MWKKHKKIEFNRCWECHGTHFNTTAQPCVSFIAMIGCQIKSAIKTFFELKNG